MAPSTLHQGRRRHGTDNFTGLVWLKRANCFGEELDALTSAEVLARGQCGLNDGSKAGDWRLPNVNELESLVHAGRADQEVSFPLTVREDSNIYIPKNIRERSDRMMTTKGILVGYIGKAVARFQTGAIPLGSTSYNFYPVRNGFLFFFGRCLAVFFSLFLSASPLFAQWTFYSLHPTDGSATQSIAKAVSGGQVAGELRTSDDTPHAALWRTPKTPFPTLMDTSAGPSGICGMSGGVQVGNRGPGMAFWRGEPDEYFNVVNPSGLSGGSLQAVLANKMVGYAFGGEKDHPVIYTLTGNTTKTGVDLLPDGKQAGHLYAIAGATKATLGIQAGYVEDVNVTQAALWRGSAASYVDLHPTQGNWVHSSAFAAFGGFQGGLVEDDKRNRHAALWNGTAESFVDLHPTAEEFGDYDSFIYGMTDGVQVGYLMSPSGEDILAALWEGTAGSFFNLNSVLPSKYIASQAWAADRYNGELWVVGNVYNSETSRIEAGLWVRSEPVTCTYKISRASKTFAKRGGKANVRVRATGSSSCSGPSVAVSDPSWITATVSFFEKDKGSVSVTVSANNTTSSRTGFVAIGNQVFSISQRGGSL